METQNQVTNLQDFIKPDTFITVNVSWLPANFMPLMPVVAHMIEATIFFDTIHGAN